ncbi:thiamine pyrophosphate-binding protein [Mesorhizobium sp. A623]
MSRTVAEALVDVLEEVGAKQIFGLIGDSLNPLGDAVRQSKIEWVGVRHATSRAVSPASRRAIASSRKSIEYGFDMLPDLLRSAYRI